MPQYELKSVNSQFNVSTKEDGTGVFQVGIISGVTGDTYGFIKGDTTNIDIPSWKSKTGQELDDAILAGAAAFVAQKYPNT